jgi:caffeoyl-CoA O-methyltransferase
VGDVPKSFALSPEIHAYLVAHGTPPDAVQRALIEETRALGGVSIMQIAPEQGAFLTLLTRLIGARRAIEVGTFTGYSALCIARGLPPDGRLLCCDVSEEWTAIARRHWERAGVAHRIELVLAPALQTLDARLAGGEAGRYDFAFIDADKTGYLAYYERLMQLVRPGGLIVVDNTLWSGDVANPANRNPDTVAIREFNDRLLADPRIELSLLPLGDGLTLARRRPEGG